MALPPGSRLGPYEILAPLGAGGMGEVYRARDTRLGREVAIKILPEQLAAAPEARQRFEREARAVSSLNHPHICTLYDIGRDGGTDFLVMEYLDGGTLAQKIRSGALSGRGAAEIAAQVARGLAAAMRGCDALKVTWDRSQAETSSPHEIMDEYRGLATQKGLSALNRGDPAARLANAAKTVEAEFIPRRTLPTRRWSL